MKIPFIDLGAQHKGISADIERAISKVIKNNDFILGSDVRTFEEEFAEFCGCRYAVGVSSGTAALFLALKSLGIKENDEVIVPDFTFIATALAVSYTGARPLFVDIEEESYNIDPAKIRKAVTKNTKAIIPVHLFGLPANMPEISKLAKENNLKIIEDACQAHGSAIKMPDGRWKKAGSLGGIGCFSFYPSKNLGGFGDGGMITTDNEEIYKFLLKLRDCGRISKYEHDIIGYNARLDSLQAAVLRIKLKKLDNWNKMRRNVAGLYDSCLKGTGVITPGKPTQSEHVYHAYSIRSAKRDQILKNLTDNNIGAAIYYQIPLHLQKAYAYLGHKEGDFPISEKISKEIISLPMHPYLKPAQVKIIVKIIKNSLIN